jgi:hypothetical protein
VSREQDVDFFSCYVILYKSVQDNSTTMNKLQKLLQDGRTLYHAQDLAVLWGVSSPNTLYTTIKRYTKNGALGSVYKGFYTTRPISEIDPLLLGLTSLHRYGYLSTESILLEKGIIFQDIKYVTLVSDISKRFELDKNNFLVRKMKDVYLKNSAGIVFRDGIRKATLERAVADLLYFNPHYYFDNPRAINWKKVKDLQKIIGY